MTIPPYTFANGDTHGEPDRTPAPASAHAPPPPRVTLAERARLARRRRETDPEWANRSKASRKRLLDLDAREARGLR